MSSLISAVRSAASFSAGSAVAWKSSRSVLDWVPRRLLGLHRPNSKPSGSPRARARRPSRRSSTRPPALKALGVGLDRREGVVVHRDHRPGADELGRDHGVVAIHRVVAADRQQRDVDRVALGDQLHVAEQAGVAGVVDGDAADVDQQARRRCRVTIPCSALKGDSSEPAIVFVCQAGTSLIQPQSNSTVPPRLGSLTAVDALAFEPLGDLDDRDAVGAGALRDRDRVGDVVDVAVADRDVGRLDLLGGGDRGRVVGLQERVDQDGRLPLAELEARLAVELDLHRFSSSPSGSVGFGQLVMQCPADGDANHHRHSRLLGEQRADRGDALVGVGHGGGLQRLRFVGLAEPAALGERGGEHPLQLRRRPRDDPLRLGEALGVGQPLDRGLELARVHRSTMRPGLGGGPSRRFMSVPPGARGGVAGEQAGEAADERRRRCRRRGWRSTRRSAGRAGRRRRRRRRSGRTPGRSRASASARRIANQAASAPSARPLPPAITSKPSWPLAMPLAASMPSEPQATISSAVAALPRRFSRPIAEDRQGDRDDEQIADVDVGEGGGQVAPPFVARTGRSGRRTSRPRRRSPSARGSGRPSRGSRPASRRGGRRRRRAAAQGGRDEAPGRAPARLRPRARRRGAPASAPACAAARRSTGTRSRTGLTSEPQFLQMTLSSVSLMIDRG